MTGCAGFAPSWSVAAVAQQPGADFTVRIVTTTVEIAPGHDIRTTTYGGTVPGPLLRMREGKPVTVDVINDTDGEDVVHWHGQKVPPSVDGVIELGTPAVPARGSRRYRFVPGPRGTKWYHSHVGMGEITDRTGFSGEFGFVVIDPRDDPAAYDREVFLALHEWQPTLVETQGERRTSASLVQPAMSMGGGMMGGMMGNTMLEASYRLFSINGRALGHGDPVRVRAGERVLLRMLNASATLTHRLALPGHQFTVVALDGNPVPVRRTVNAVEIGVAERVDAIVEMQHPGRWVLGSTDAEYRAAGMGVVVEYAGRRGAAAWADQSYEPWQYANFGAQHPIAAPDGAYRLVLRQLAGGKNRWGINDAAYPSTAPVAVERGKRYRIGFVNMSTMEHPMHLHGHVFQLASVDGVSTSGVMKDTVVVRPMMGEVEIDLVADNPGRFLLHCHNELHMGGGLATVLEYRRA